MDFTEISILNKEYVRDSAASCTKSAAVAGNAERSASDKIASELTLYADKVTVEEFKFSPRAQYGWVPLSVFMLFFAYFCYFFVPLLSAILSIVSFVPVILYFCGKTEFLGLFFGERLSQNVYAVKKAESEPKRRIVLCTHVDASEEMPIKNKYGQAAVNSLCIISGIGGLYMLAISVAACVLNGAGFTLSFGVSLIIGLVGLIFLPFWVFLCKLVGRKPERPDFVTPYTAVSIFREMKEKKLTLPDTELALLILGAEEHGAVGAKVFQESLSVDIDSIYVCLTADETITITDKVNITSCDEDVCALLKLSGYEIGADVPYVTKQGRKYTAVQVFGKCHLSAAELGVCNNDDKAQSSYAMLLKAIELYSKDGLQNLYEESNGAAEN